MSTSPNTTVPLPRGGSMPPSKVDEKVPPWPRLTLKNDMWYGVGLVPSATQLPSFWVIFQLAWFIIWLGSPRKALGRKNTLMRVRTANTSLFSSADFCGTSSMLK